MRMEGIQPVTPAAFPAARVRIPAPATLLARLNTDVERDAVPSVSFSLSCVSNCLVVATGRRRSVRTASLLSSSR